jgi:hypothetical protein
LVHACLEGPEVGVYYRGTGEITNNKYVEIDLPPYVSLIASDFTILATPVCKYSFEEIKNNEPEIILLGTSKVINNKFIIYGKNTSFYWTAYGKRNNIEIEPLKNETKVYGSEPYKWI